MSGRRFLPNRCAFALSTLLAVAPVTRPTEGLSPWGIALAWALLVALVIGVLAIAFVQGLRHVERGRPGELHPRPGGA